MRRALRGGFSGEIECQRIDPSNKHFPLGAGDFFLNFLFGLVNGQAAFWTSPRNGLLPGARSWTASRVHSHSRSVDLSVQSEAFEGPRHGAIPMQELCHDWEGEALRPSPSFALIEDPCHLWLVAARQQASAAHPTARCGEFQEQLWCHEVAELFVAATQGSHYLEFNLAPTGAWWMAAFEAPRRARKGTSAPQVITHGTPPGADHWHAALGIPLDWLRREVGWNAQSRLNVCLILDTRPQRFVSACDLGGGEPDFHRPDFYQIARRTPPKKS